MLAINGLVMWAVVVHGEAFVALSSRSRLESPESSEAASPRAGAR